MSVAAAKDSNNTFRSETQRRRRKTHTCHLITHVYTDKIVHCESQVTWYDGSNDQIVCKHN